MGESDGWVIYQPRSLLSGYGSGGVGHFQVLRAFVLDGCFPGGRRQTVTLFQRQEDGQVEEDGDDREDHASHGPCREREPEGLAADDHEWHESQYG